MQRLAQARSWLLLRPTPGTLLSPWRVPVALRVAVMVILTRFSRVGDRKMYIIFSMVCMTEFFKLCLRCAPPPFVVSGMSVKSGTLTRLSVHPASPVLLTKNGPHGALITPLGSIKQPRAYLFKV